LESWWKDAGFLSEKKFATSYSVAIVVYSSVKCSFRLAVSTRSPLDHALTDDKNRQKNTVINKNIFLGFNGDSCMFEELDLVNIACLVIFATVINCVLYILTA
jgi:hypothetical protein